MVKIYVERHWIKEDKHSNNSIHTFIDSSSRGVTSIVDNPEGEPITDHIASVNFVGAGQAFGIAFDINDTKSQEDAMKALSIMIDDLTKLRNEVIKLS